MIAATPEDAGPAGRCARWRALPAAVRDRVSVTEMESAVGGGSLPGADARVVGLVVIGPGADGCWRAGFGPASPAVVGRVESGAVLLDLRTVEPSDDAALGQALARALAAPTAGAEGDDDRRHRDRRPHRPRQDDAAPGADRHRRRPAARGAAARDDDRCRVRAPDARRRHASSTSSTSRATTGWSATCSSGPARSMRRCSSSPPTTGRAPRRSSTWRCSTRSGSAHGLAVVTKADVAGPERTAEVVAAVERLLEATTLAGSPVLAVSSVDGDGVAAVHAALVGLRDRVLGRGRGAPRTRRPAHASRSTASSRSRAAAPSSPGTLRGRPLVRGATLRLVPGDRYRPRPRDPGPRRRRSRRPSPGGRR